MDTNGSARRSSTLTRSRDASGWSVRMQATGWPWMSSRDDQPDRHLVTREVVDQAQVEGALAEALVDVALLGVDHLDAGRAVARVEVEEGRGEQARRRRVDSADPELAHPHGLVAGSLAEAVDGLEHLGHVLEQVEPLPTDARAGAPPVEQRGAELLLELGDGLAQGRLRDVHGLAGAPQRPVRGHCREVLQLFDPHRCLLCRASRGWLPVTSDRRNLSRDRSGRAGDASKVY